MVLGHIQAAANQGECEWFLASNTQLSSPHLGIWTKHLKAKTELHQTVIDRCLKSLVQKQLIKSVKGVKVFPLVSLFSDVFPDLLLCSIQRARFI